MLGGYYLGSYYLGISGALSSLETLIIQNAIHGHYADNVILMQYHSLLVDWAIHNPSSDNVDLTSIYKLIASSCKHNNIADNITLKQLHYLLTDNTRHTVTSDKILKIFDWNELGKFFGIYLKDYVDNGTLDKITLPNSSIYTLEHNEIGTFGTVSNDTGIYIKENTEQGIL